MPVFQNVTLAPGLYFVSTPIGSARDITLRALDILNAADVIAAEDTRTARKLMDIHGVALRDRKMISYHDHNGARQRPALLATLGAGQSVAYMAEAGTPLLADPGFVLGREAAREGHRVFAAAGASAALAALTVSGLPRDRFLFLGFAPVTKVALQRFLRDYLSVQATLIFYESPKRVARFLEALEAEAGPDRRAVLCRELTKKFEEVIRGSVSELRAQLQERALKGECVILVDRGDGQKISKEDIRARLAAQMLTNSSSSAAKLVAEELGLSRREVYQIALTMKDAE